MTPGEGSGRDRVHPDPERFLEMALEMDLDTGAAEQAADQLVSEGRPERLADLLGAAGPGTALATHLWERMATPDVMRELLEREAPPASLLGRLARLGAPETVDVLVEAARAVTDDGGGSRVDAPRPGRLAALRILAADWGDHPGAGEVLAAAREAEDPLVRQAAKGGADEAG